MVTGVTRAYKTKLTVNDAQVTTCRRPRRPAGAVRWAYTWGLQRKQEAYRATGKHPSAIGLHRELNALKKTAVPWMDAVSKCAPQEALRHLATAIAHVFRRCKRKREGKLHGKVGYAQGKSKQRGVGSFRLTGSPAQLWSPPMPCSDAMQ
jgi:putative transposase